MIFVTIAALLLLAYMMFLLAESYRRPPSHDAIHAQLTEILNKEDAMAGELDKLEADVASITTVVGSAITLLQGLKTALDAAIASGDMSRVAAVNTALENQTTALAAAVAANTPATP